MAQAVRMIDLLTETLQEFGLELDMAKTKMLSTTVLKNETTLIETEHGFVELLAAGRVHKYLGRAFSGNLRHRGQAAADHRISCAWCKFRSLEKTLTDKRVNIKLRLRLFSSAVTPSLVYSLDTTPLTNTQLQRFDVVQNKMLRKMVGWLVLGDEAWDVIGHRMKMRLEAALLCHPVRPWSEEINTSKQKLLSRLNGGSMPHICQLALAWMPGCCAGRARGRPRTRCFDNIP